MDLIPLEERRECTESSWQSVSVILATLGFSLHRISISRIFVWNTHEIINHPTTCSIHSSTEYLSFLDLDNGTKFLEDKNIDFEADLFIECELLCEAEEIEEETVPIVPYLSPHLDVDIPIPINRRSSKADWFQYQYRWHFVSSEM